MSSVIINRYVRERETSVEASGKCFIPNPGSEEGEEESDARTVFNASSVTLHKISLPMSTLFDLKISVYSALRG